MTTDKSISVLAGGVRAHRLPRLSEWTALLPSPPVPEGIVQTPEGGGEGIVLPVFSVTGRNQKSEGAALFWEWNGNFAL